MKEEMINIISTDIYKSIDEDKRLFTCVALRPNVVDAHGDFYNEEVVMKASHDFMEYCLNTSLQHQIELEKSDVSVVESYISPVDFELNGGNVKQGDWVVSLKIHNDEIWKACKEGKFKGLSVGVSCSLEEV